MVRKVRGAIEGIEVMGRKVGRETMRVLVRD